MDIIRLLLKEMDEESAKTLKMLQRVPDDNWEWKPHEKSMNLKTLSVHIAELPSWISMGLSTTELDFAATPYKPTEIKTTTDLLELFERSLYQGRTALEHATEEDLLPEWTLRNGDQVYSVMTKYELIRHSFSQTVHHRAQLGVYLRLLDIPIPGTYGPSADEMNF